MFNTILSILDIDTICIAESIRITTQAERSYTIYVVYF